MLSQPVDVIIFYVIDALFNIVRRDRDGCHKGVVNLRNCVKVVRVLDGEN